MAQDDLVPDSALIARLCALLDALGEVKTLTAMRSHLPVRALIELEDHFKGALEEVTRSAQPDDEINAKARSRMRHEFVILTSGVAFYPYDPRADEVRHVDIVNGLVNTNRYGGHTMPRPISVAEHSIKVAAIVEHLLNEEVLAGNLLADTIPVAVLHALLHDGHEGLGLGDMPRPLEARLADVFGTPWTRIKQRVQDVIIEAYDLPPLTAEAASAIEDADIYAFYCEVHALKSDSDLSRYDFPRIPPPAVLDIAHVKKEVDIDRVRELFDSEVQRLVSIIGGQLPGGAKPVRVAITIDDTAKVYPVTQTLAEIMHDVPIPGERKPNDPQSSKLGEYYPQLSRGPRSDDISESSWRSAVQSAKVQIPAKLLDAPEFAEGPTLNVKKEEKEKEKEIDDEQGRTVARIKLPPEPKPE